MSNNSRAIRPTNRVNVGSHDTARVWRVGKRKQGGAWVRTFVVQLDASDAVRTVRGDLVRLAV
jgi:hypothetical protein